MQRQGFYKNAYGNYWIEQTLSNADLENLHQHKRLQSLFISNLNVKNLNFLLPLTTLKSVKIYQSRIKDYTALTQLSRLKTLHLIGCPIQDYSWLASLTDLMEFHMNGVRNNNADNFTFLANMKKLEKLRIYHAPKFEIFPNLANCHNLSRLDVMGCKRLTDIQAIANIPNLQYCSVVLTPQKPQDLIFIMQKQSMKGMTGAYGSGKADKEFHDLLKQYNLQYG